MSITLRHDSNDVYRVDIAGTLHRSDFVKCEAELKSELQRVGAVKLLCVLDGFEGWEPSADWTNLGFYVKHGDDIKRIAIVGDERWRSEMMMFAAADLRKAPVEFFPANGLALAREWLAG